MRDVVVAGVGQTRFGQLDRSLPELGREAVIDAIADAEIDRTDIESAFVGNVGGPADPQRGIVGQVCLRNAGVTGIPISNIENACSSSSCAVHHAYREIAGGFVDVAIVLGVEKMTGISTAEATGGLASAADVRRESRRGLTFPGMYAMRANAYLNRYHTNSKRFREALAQISVKNHRNALDNPYAHFQKEISVEDVCGSSVIADPLRLYDMCPNSDGAAALILAAADVIDTENRITVEASVHQTGRYDDPNQSFARSDVETVAKQAYANADITPGDVDLFEVHDASTFAELQNMEMLGIVPPGEGVEMVLDGTTARGGEIPINPSGGLKARGHPVGATGVAQLNELVWQLRGDAGDRQVSGVTVGLAENAGGTINGVGANTTIHILQSQ